MQEALRLFATVDSATTEWILTKGSERAIARGEAITTEGREVTDLVVVLNGLFEVRLSGHDEPVAHLGPGELIGEISWLEGTTASASVIASEDSRVLCVARADLEAAVSVNPTFAADLYRGLALVLSRRLRERQAPAVHAGKESADVAIAESGWPGLTAFLEDFKELLRRMDVGTEHGALAVPQPLHDEIQGRFNELCRKMEHCSRSLTNAEDLKELNSSLQRELLPYIYLTRLGQRIVTKPRGYAGDFLTIDLIYRNEPSGVPPLGPLVDGLLLNAPVGHAVRNRRELLAEEIACALERAAGPTQVTSLACGPAAEIFDVLKENSGEQIRATLIDIDFQALAFVAERRDAAGLKKRIRLEHANLVHLASGRQVLDLRDQHLIYSIGLIDYFEDPFVVALLNWTHGRLCPGGRVILGNFHTCDPVRAFMDLVLDWKLIHRAEEDMNRLFQASKFGRPCTDIRFEAQGINMFASCEKTGE